jgi:enoyl-CoA hydratase
MDYRYLIFEEEDDIFTLKINRLKALNALNSGVLRELEHIFLELKENDNIRVVIITGSGEKSFIAGADVSEMKDMLPRDAKEFACLGNRIFSLIENCNKVVIAAINGFSLGGGNELALACDIRIASEIARFGQPEVGLGITTGFGGTQRLAKIIGVAKAKELLFTAEVISSREAEKIGLINKLVAHEELMKEAKEMAKKIAKNAPFAVRMTKESINFGLEEGIEKGISFESNAFSMCFSTADQKKGMEAFLRKDKYEFKGR